ncbi:hypothetical protein R6Q57_023220 [Mikania cordata]
MANPGSWRMFVGKKASLIQGLEKLSWGLVILRMLILQGKEIKEVKEVKKFLLELNTIKLDGMKLGVNVAKYNKEGGKQKLITDGGSRRVVHGDKRNNNKHEYWNFF